MAKSGCGANRIPLAPLVRPGLLITQTATREGIAWSIHTVKLCCIVVLCVRSGDEGMPVATTDDADDEVIYEQGEIVYKDDTWFLPSYLIDENMRAVRDIRSSDFEVS